MKKTLLAAALLAGFAGAASAQSSVTLYGIVDGGLRYNNVSYANGDGASNFGLAYGQQSGNRFGLRGGSTYFRKSRYPTLSSGRKF
jgi:predicted porin